MNKSRWNALNKEATSVVCLMLHAGLEALGPVHKYELHPHHSLQRAKKVVADSPGLVDFAIGLVNSVLNLPDGQAKIFRRIKITKVL